MDLSLSGGDGAQRGVQRQRAAAQKGGGGGAPPQLHGDPGQQLPGVEGLGHIVRRAAQEEPHLLLHVPLGAQDDDRDALKLWQHLLAA